MKTNISKLMLIGCFCGFGLTMTPGSLKAGDIQVNNATVQGVLNITNGMNGITLNASSNGNYNVLNLSGGLSLPLAVDKGGAIKSLVVALDSPSTNWGGALDYYQAGSHTWRLSSGDGSPTGSRKLMLMSFNPDGWYFPFLYFNPDASILLQGQTWVGTNPTNGGTASGWAGVKISCSGDGNFAVSSGFQFGDNSKQLHAAQGLNAATNGYGLVNGNDSGKILIKSIVPGQNVNIVDSGTSMTLNVATPQTVSFTNPVLASSSSWNSTAPWTNAPQQISLYLVCTTANNGYAVGDQIKAETAASATGAYMQPFFTYGCNNTSLFVSTGAYANLYIAPKGGGALVNIYPSRTNWALKLTATY